MKEKPVDGLLTTADVIAMTIKKVYGKKVTFNTDEVDFLEYAFLYFSEHPEVMNVLKDFVDGARKGEIQPVNIQ
jgi:hypothetical protein